MRIACFLLAALLLSSCLSKQGAILNPGQNTVNKPIESTRPIKSTPSSNTEPSKSTSLSGLDYIAKYKVIAIQEMLKTGIPASIKLAQGMLESGNGNSRLATQANNHFGIKCTSDWSGGKIYHDDDEKNDCFRIYTNPEESFRDHSAFLQRKRYEGLFALDPQDYKAWATGLKAAGYATNPRYAELLINLIERYDLDQYDRQLTDQVTQVPVTSQSVINTTPPIKSKGTMTTHQVAAGETLSSIASRYGTTASRIIEINQLKSKELHLGQLLLVED